jgi:phosphoserine phosphatase RsbU/P
VASLQPYPGIEWRVVAVLPESAFLAKATAAQHRAVVLSLVALIGGMVLALTMARQAARPLFTLIAHVRRLGRGDLDSRLDLHVAREFSELSEAVNRMADDLKERLELQQAMQVAQQVQQSLLPAQTPHLAHLEVVGRSQYCDSTGGDYYDFIDVAHHSGDGALIAVGDVMGHGIGAALLMASARAALRTHCIDEPDLGRLLQRMNYVLLGEARHYRFVTMVLLSIQPQAGVLRWACAGHDLPLVFNPHTQQFLRFDGGDIPLGIDPDVPYQQYEVGGLCPGSLLVIGTDGVWETTNADGEMFGRERLASLLRACGQCTAVQIADRVE